MRRRTRNRRSAPVKLAAAFATAALVLAACNGDADVADEAPDDTDAAAPSFLTMATGSTGGTYFPLGGAMAGVWNDNLDDVRIGTQSSGASVENLRLLHAGEVQLVMAVNGVGTNAIAGEGPFEEDGPLDFAFLGNVYGEVTQIVARADAGINSIEDMAGKRIQIGPPGSGTEVAARTILETAGVDPDNDIEVFQDGFGDAADALRDGTVDAAFGILALPAGSIEDVARTTDLTFVSITGDLLDTLLGNDETLSALEVEPETYPGQDDTVTWVTNWATLYAPSDMDEDLVYDIVRVLYEENESIAAAHVVGRQIQIDTALDGLSGIPIHPGAERYYEEVGAL